MPSSVLMSSSVSYPEMYIYLETQENWAKLLMKNATLFFPLITRRFRCARLASIFRIPEVEFESGFTMPRFVLGGDAHFRCGAVKTDVDFLCVVFFRMLYVVLNVVRPKFTVQ